MNTYWDGKGKYQQEYAGLVALIPVEGAVANPKQNPALEKLRKAANCYYDLFNNGLCNRASEFRRVFGFSGSTVKAHKMAYDPLENKLDEFILAALKEQAS